MDYRHVVDHRDGAHLVYPDALTMEAVVGEDVGGVTSIHVKCHMRAPTKALQTLPQAREVIVDDAHFIIRRPQDKSIVGFHVVSTGSLSAEVILLVMATAVTDVLKNITTVPAYFDPEYYGNTESFWSPVTIAVANLDAFQIEQVRGTPTLATQIILLVSSIQSVLDLSDKEHAKDLADLMLSSSSFQKTPTLWKAVIDPGPKQLVLERVQERIDPIRGTSENLVIQ